MAKLLKRIFLSVKDKIANFAYGQLEINCEGASSFKSAVVASIMRVSAPTEVFFIADNLQSEE